MGWITPATKMKNNVNSGLINPKRLFNCGVPFVYHIVTIWMVPQLINHGLLIRSWHDHFLWAFWARNIPSRSEQTTEMDARSRATPWKERAPGLPNSPDLSWSRSQNLWAPSERKNWLTWSIWRWDELLCENKGAWKRGFTRKIWWDGCLMVMRWCLIYRWP